MLTLSESLFSVTRGGSSFSVRGGGLKFDKKIYTVKGSRGRPREEFFISKGLQSKAYSALFLT